MDHFDGDRAPEGRLLGFVDAPHAADADDFLQQVGSADDTADKRVRRPAGGLLVGRGSAGGTKTRVSFYRRPALVTQAHPCSISHAVAGSN